MSSTRRIGCAVRLIAILIPLAGCSSHGAGPFCRIAEPITVTELDRLTPETARAILAHNEIGAELCGWRRSKT